MKSKFSIDKFSDKRICEKCKGKLDNIQKEKNKVISSSNYKHSMETT